MKWWQMDIIRDEFEKQLKHAKLFEQLVDGNKDIFTKRIKLVKVDNGNYKKFYDWHKWWKDIHESKIGIRVNFANHNCGQIAINLVPDTYTVESAETVFRYLGKTSYMNCFLEAYHLIVDDFPELKLWCISRRDDLILNKEFAQKVLNLAHYFKNGAEKNCYITQWKIEGIDTKFHQKNFDTFRKIANAVLNINLKNKDEFYEYFSLRDRYSEINTGIVGNDLYFNGCHRFSITVWELAKWDKKPDKVIIFENKDVGSYVLDEVTSDVSCVIFYGTGASISGLKNVDWLQNCQLYYYGDLDKDGFAILSELRGKFPSLRSFLMEEYTPDITDRKGNPRSIANLTEKELECYNQIISKNTRFEQEHIDKEKLIQTVKCILENKL